MSGVTVPVGPQVHTRIQAVDILRGLVMVLMAIDHTRDYIHAGAMAFRPEDLAQTTPAIFLTRWITHFCAPAFMFCAGIGAFLRLERRGSKAELSRFLATRGLWLIVLEFTLVRAGFLFNLSFSPLFLLVFWALGWSMIALALLVHLPPRALLVVSVAMIALHNLLDPIRSSSFGALSWLWQMLHEQGFWLPAGPQGPAVIVAYPLVPWIGVMAAGFCFGEVYRMAPERRRAFLLRLGLALTAGFIVLRAINGYGDPRPWAVQERGPIYTLLSFLNTTKYPASLAFLLMTLGPAILLLRWADGWRRDDRDPLLVFGRVPLLYFVLHIPLVHLLAVGLTWLQYGAAPFLWQPPPTLGTPRTAFPADYGWELWVVYGIWALALVLLYPVCRWFAAYKRRTSAWWVSYL